MGYTAAPTPYLVEYAMFRNDLPHGQEFLYVDRGFVTQFIVPKSDALHDVVVATRYSLEDGHSVMRVISHRKKQVIQTSTPNSDIPFQEEKRSIRFRPEDASVAELVDSSGKVIATAWLSDELPNIYPWTLRHPEITRGVVRFERKDKVNKLTRVIRDPDEILRLLAYIDTEGYLQLGMDYVKERSPEVFGMSFDQVIIDLKKRIAEWSKD